MCKKSFVFWYFVFLFFPLSTNSLRNFTNDNKQDNNLTIKLQLHSNFTKKDDKETNFNRYNLLKKFTIDNKNAQYVSRINPRSNDCKDDNLTQNELPAHYTVYYKDGNQIPVELETNFTEVDKKDNFDNDENDNKKYKIVPYETCHNSTCIRLCCDNCISERAVFPNIRNYWSDSIKGENKKVDEVFQLSVFPFKYKNSCQNRTTTIKIPLYEKYVYYKYIFFENGTLYFPYLNEFVELLHYCLAPAKYNQFDAFICLEALTETMEKERYNFGEIRFLRKRLIILSISCCIISMLCMLIIFLVYSILPELQNVHSFMLRRCSSLTFTLYMLLIINHIFEVKTSICVAIALIKYFCYLANYLWLSVMSFDMWYKFRDIRLLQRNVRQQERKKYIYSIFVWGSSFILTIIIITMNYVSDVPEIFQPRFGENNVCWFSSKTTRQLYDYGPISICIISSICLSIYTALKIARYEKDTAFHLKNIQSQCYNENKKWFNLYLKFFIVLFIIKAIHLTIVTAWEFWGTYFNFAMVLQWGYVRGCIIVLNHIQNISILIIFVCKKKIGRLLLKRFSQNHFNHRSVFKIWTHSGCHRIEQVHHNVRDTFSTETYRKSKTLT